MRADTTEVSHERIVICSSFADQSATRSYPVVLSVPEAASFLAAMQGTRLVAALIYGFGLRVSQCCEARVKAVDLDQRLLSSLRALPEG